MANYASVTLMGHLGRDPETKQLSSAAGSVTSFSLATTVKRKDTETTTWWNCQLFGKRGEALARYLKKGDPVLVAGEPLLRAYQKKDGGDGQALEVTCSDFSFVGAKGDSTGVSSPAPQPSYSDAPKAPQSTHNANDDDDIPF
jgi:single-strand DNA-binding protein